MSSSPPENALWRVSSVKPVPWISRSPVLSISQSLVTDYAIAVMKHPNPVGGGLAMEAVLESAGPECVVPGQVTPLHLLGVKVWPVEVDLKFLEPVGKELKMLGKVKRHDMLAYLCVRISCITCANVGPVYKGVLSEGQETAVKRLSRASG